MIALLARDLRLAFRAGGGFGLGLAFFLIVVTLVPFSVGPQSELLARMAVTGRPIWLFDEPTVSLDAEAVQLFAQAVRGHLDGGGAAVIATHIDLGLPQARELDVAQYRAEAATVASADEAFL